jgi:hypothetical protein
MILADALPEPVNPPRRSSSKYRVYPRSRRVLTAARSARASAS